LAQCHYVERGPTVSLLRRDGGYRLTGLRVSVEWRRLHLVNTELMRSACVGPLMMKRIPSEVHAAPRGRRGSAIFLTPRLPLEGPNRLLSILKASRNGQRDILVVESDRQLTTDASVVWRHVGTGGSTAIGFLDAGRRLRRDLDVTLCLGSPNRSDSHTILLSRDAKSLERLVVVAAKPAIRERGFGCLGWKVRDLADADADQLSAELRRLKESLDPALLLVGEQWFRPWTESVCRDAPTADIESHDQDGVCRALADELLSAAKHDSSVVPVLTNGWTVWDPLCSELGDQAVVIDRSELASALPWCGAIAASGCRPIVILSFDDLLAHQDTIRRELSGEDRGSSLVVLSAPDPQSLAMSHDRLPYLPGMTVATPVSETQARRALRRALDRTQLASIVWIRSQDANGHEKAGDVKGGSKNGDRRPFVGLAGTQPAERRAARKQTPRDTSPPAVEPPRSVPDRLRESAHVKESIVAADRLAVARKPLSPFIWEWISRYSAVGDRPTYLWKWCQHGLELITLTCVDDTLQQHLGDTKLLAVIYGVLLDDIADRGRNPQFLRYLVNASSAHEARRIEDLPAHEQSYAQLTFSVWDEYQERLREYPRYEEFADLLAYDNNQVANTMWYSRLVNENLRLMNLAEHDLYAPHNMQMMTFATTDLMGSLDFDPDELGQLREAIWHAQCMGRIGNLISTWEREIEDGDFTSGVFARLIESHRLRVDDLMIGNLDQIRAAVRSGNVESYFLDQWAKHRCRVKAMVGQLHSVDLQVLLSGLDRLIHMELGSRGLK